MARLPVSALEGLLAKAAALKDRFPDVKGMSLNIGYDVTLCMNSMRRRWRKALRGMLFRCRSLTAR
jgi:hypothetical protein